MVRLLVMALLWMEIGLCSSSVAPEVGMSKWKLRTGPGAVSGAATETKNLSEQLVEDFCDHHNIEWWRIKEAPPNRMPNYAIRVRSHWCILEVKQLEPTDKDNDLVGKLRWIAAGKRLHDRFRSAEHQLRRFSARSLPTMICLLDTTVSFHDEGFHIHNVFRWNEKARVSAVAVLRQPSGSEVIVDLYHNQFADVPIRQDVAAPFVRRQTIMGIDAAKREKSTLAFDVDDPAYEVFWRSPEEV